MKKVKINEQDIFDKFHTYSKKDVKDVLVDLYGLVHDGAQCTESEELSDKVLDVIEYCTYNKGQVVYKHKLGMLLFSGRVENGKVVLNLAFCKSEKVKEIWRQDITLKWAEDKCIMCTQDLQLIVDGQKVELE